MDQTRAGHAVSDVEEKVRAEGSQQGDLLDPSRAMLFRHKNQIDTLFTKGAKESATCWGLPRGYIYQWCDPLNY